MIWVVDLEATMHADNQDQRPFTSEIVQLGIARVDLDAGRIRDIVEFFITPISSVAGPALHRLTSIPPEKFHREGIAFPTVAQLLRDSDEQEDKPHRAWVSWGAYDRNMIEKACTLYSVEPFFSRTHFDLKRIHWMLRKGCRGKPLGLGKALRMERLQFQGIRHTAGDDASNTARILLKLSGELKLAGLR